MSKRARDDTEEIIQAALREDQEKKSLLKRDKAVRGWCWNPTPGLSQIFSSDDSVHPFLVSGDKGLTLEELEEAEGGTVRESRVGKAQRDRASRRKGGRAGGESAACVEGL